MDSIHRFKLESLDGETIDFSTFNGKKIVVVNVASECGFTAQYSQLQELADLFADSLVIIGCPCNDFGGQEPGPADEIRSFCSRRFGVTFPLTAKLNIVGQNPHPLYKWLTTSELNGVADSSVSWNFQKYLLDEGGFLVKMLPPAVSPLDEELLKWVSPI